jgi:hypothetical protein
VTVVRGLALVLVAVALASCGDRTSIEAGGRAPGDVLTVYLLVPYEGPSAGAARDMIRGAKLALAQADGRAGEVTVQFATAALPEGDDAIADAVEGVVRDVGTIAVIGDLDAGAARVTAPLLNAAGILLVSPGPPASDVAQPAAQRSYFPLDLAAARAPVPPGFAAAFPGVEPGRFAGTGFVLMNRVLEALRRAGDRAPVRRAVIEAF